MPDFGRPEYRSYVELCRELRLERQFEEGDQYWREPTVHDQEVLGAKGGVSMYYGNLDWDEAHRSDDRHFWLPTLSDWLELLEEVGIGVIEVERRDDQYIASGAERAWDCEWSCSGAQLAEAPTREEAAARLWMAVSGKTPDPKAPSGI